MILKSTTLTVLPTSKPRASGDDPNRLPVDNFFVQ